MFSKYSYLEDWYRMHISDEVHFGYDIQDKLKIIQKADMHYCQNSIEKVYEPNEKNTKRYHCWVVVEHNFKFDIHFYEIFRNTNSKMSQQVYIEKSLNQLSSHSFKLITILYQRRIEIWDIDWGSLTFYAYRKSKIGYNSPNLAPIENC